ncbi:MAG: class I SAM-dependent methyltransferase [Synechococcus sp.]
MSQQWDAAAYSDTVSYVAKHGLPVLQLLDPRPNERILDLGCGDGTLTKQIEAFGSRVHGVDSSPSMIAAAKAKGLSASVVSGDALSFSNEFDAVFSNAALHWMTNSDRVLQGVFHALKPGGRFVGELGGKGNIDALVVGMQSVFDAHPEFGEFDHPWFFPGDDDYREALQRHGFSVDSLELIPRPTPLQSGVREWLTVFSNGITANLTAQQKTTFLDDVEQLVRPKLFTNNGWVADSVRLRFSASKCC